MTDNSALDGDASVLELFSSPIASPARPSPPRTTATPHPSHALSQTRVDNVFKASKLKPGAKPGANPPMAPFPMMKMGHSAPRSQIPENEGVKKKARSRYEFSEDDIIELD